MAYRLAQNKGGFWHCIMQCMTNKSRECYLLPLPYWTREITAVSHYTTFQKITISYATASLKRDGFQIHVK